MKTRLLPLLLGVALISACNKDDDKDDNQNNTAQPSSPQVEIEGTSGALIAINTGTLTETPIGPFTTFIGSAVASFEGEDAGMTTCESEELDYTNGAYIFKPSATSASIDFGSSVSWAVAGKGSIPAITYTYNRSVPKIGDLVADANVATSSELTFGIDYSNSATSVSTADSVLYFVHGPGGSIQKTVAANVQTVTFTKSEMGTVGTGAGYVQAAAYNYTVQEFDGYKVAFVNEGVFTKAVTLE